MAMFQQVLQADGFHFRAHRIPRRHPSDMVFDESTRTLVERGTPGLIQIEYSDGFKYYSDDSKLDTCDYCHDYADPTDPTNGAENVCSACFEEHYSWCECCEETERTDYMHYVESEGVCVCDSCRHMRYFWCHGCNELFHNDHLCEYRNTDYCQCCYEDVSYHDYPEYTVPRKWEPCGCFDDIGSRRRFGVELEIASVEDLDFLDNRAFGTELDESVQGGIELVSAPLSGDNGLQAVRDTMQGLRANNAHADNRCGFHLHVDLSDTTAEQRKAVALAYHYSKHVWYDMVDERRRDGYWSADHPYSASDCYDGDDYPKARSRYHWVNWQAYDRHKTLEIRLHQGTTVTADVVAWIKAHTRFIDRVVTMSLSEITSAMSDPDSARDWVAMVVGDDVADYHGIVG